MLGPGSWTSPSPSRAIMVWLLTGQASEDGFSAIKLTALGRPQFLVSARTFHPQNWLRTWGCWEPGT